MAASLDLLDASTRDDLRTYLQRLERVGESEVRLVARARVLAVFGCTQAPQGLFGDTPTVLVMRAFSLASSVHAEVDATVSARALLDRLAFDRPGTTFSLDVPDATSMVAWAGVLPPASGWERIGSLDAPSVAQVARDGIERVAQALPENPGEAIVRQVRGAVWNVPMAPGIPAAVAFAAESLGFLAGESVLRVTRSQSWIRVTSSRGHVLVRGIATPAPTTASTTTQPSTPTPSEAPGTSAKL